MGCFAVFDYDLHTQYASFYSGGDTNTIDDVAIDSQGNIVLAGTVRVNQFTVDNPSSHPNIVGSDIPPANISQVAAYITKLTPDGSGGWLDHPARAIQGVGKNRRGQVEHTWLTIDPWDNIYVSGECDIPADALKRSFSNVDTSLFPVENGQHRGYICSYDPSLRTRWAKLVGSAQEVAKKGKDGDPAVTLNGNYLHRATIVNDVLYAIGAFDASGPMPAKFYEVKPGNRVVMGIYQSSLDGTNPSVLTYGAQSGSLFGYEIAPTPDLGLVAVGALLNSGTTTSFDGSTVSTGACPLVVLKIANEGQIASFTSNTSSIIGSRSKFAAALRLVAPVLTAPTTVKFSSSNPAVSAPASVTVPINGSTANVSLTANPVSVATPVTVTATVNSPTLGTVTRSLDLTVLPASVGSVQITNLPLVSGVAGSGVVMLPSPAPSTGQTIYLTLTENGNPVPLSIASVPKSVTIPAGATSVGFSMTTRAVGESHVVQVRANNAQSDATILPRAATLTPASQVLSGGKTVTFTLRSAVSVVANYTYNLSTEDGGPVMPATVTIPAGQRIATFTATMPVVRTDTEFHIVPTPTDSVAPASSASVTVVAAKLLNVTGPAVVKHGTAATIRVKLNGLAAASGFAVDISVNLPGGAVNQSGTIPGGSNTQAFIVPIPSTCPAGTVLTITVTPSEGGAPVSTTLKVS